jgi:hypothetical protein
MSCLTNAKAGNPLDVLKQECRSPVIQCDRTPQVALVRGFFPTHHIDEVSRRHPEVGPHQGPGHMPPLHGRASAFPLAPIGPFAIARLLDEINVAPQAA